MKAELFDELLESVREGGSILRGETEPSRRFDIKAPDVRQIRRSTGLSQVEFARGLGISPGTLRNWEQDLRQPQGPARVLLAVVQSQPDLVFKTLASLPGGAASRSRSRKSSSTKRTTRNSAASKA